jgi:hypothetical protein
VAAWAALGLWAAPVQAADEWPAPLYAGVVVTSGGADPAVVARSLNEAVSMLVASGVYHVRPLEDLADRLGGPPGELVARCGEDLACWQAVAWRGGIDVVVHLEVATPGSRSVPVTRASAWSVEGPLGEPVVVPLPRGGGAPLEWIAETLLEPGELALKIADDGSATVDGVDWPAPGGVRTLPPGRHQVRAQFGDEVQVQVVPVLARQTAALQLAPAPKAADGPTGHRRWGLVMGPALAVGGAVALVVQRDWPGDASH